MFQASSSSRELLSNHLNWQNVFDPDNSMDRELFNNGSEEFDDNEDGVSDRLESTFEVTGVANIDVGFALTQEVGLVTPLGGGGTVAVLTQTLVATNQSAGGAIAFELVRHNDWDLVSPELTHLARKQIGELGLLPGRDRRIV